MFQKNQLGIYNINIDTINPKFVKMDIVLLCISAVSYNPTGRCPCDPQPNKKNLTSDKLLKKNPHNISLPV